jgi:hypothetical protein
LGSFISKSHRSVGCLDLTIALIGTLISSTSVEFHNRDCEIGRLLQTWRMKNRKIHWMRRSKKAIFVPLTNALRSAKDVVWQTLTYTLLGAQCFLFSIF